MICTNSLKPTIISAFNLLHMDPSFDGHIHSNTCRRSLLIFLGNALRWLTGTATTKDVNSSKEDVNQLTETQLAQKETLVHIVSILNVTRYEAHIIRHSINILMDKVDENSQDVNNLHNLTTSLATGLSYHQILLYIRSVLAKPLRLTILHQNSFYTHHGLHRCSYNRNTFSTHFTNNGSKEDVSPHRRNPTIYTTSYSLIWGYPAFLSLSLYTCFDGQQAIPTPHWCTNSGLVTTALHLQNFYIGYSTW